jgi:hypothetical protein
MKDVAPPDQIISGVSVAQSSGEMKSTCLTRTTGDASTGVPLLELAQLGLHCFSTRVTFPEAGARQAGPVN